jgi:hypothetical protein
VTATLGREYIAANWRSTRPTGPGKGAAMRRSTVSCAPRTGKHPTGRRSRYFPTGRFEEAGRPEVHVGSNVVEMGDWIPFGFAS